MDFTCFNTAIATRPGPWPELSYPLTEEELDDLWFFYVLEFGHLPRYRDAISAPEHLPSSRSSHLSFNNANDTALAPAPTTSMGESTGLIAQPPYMYPDVLGDWPRPAQSFMDTDSIEPDMPIYSPWNRMAHFPTHSLTAAHSSVPGPCSSGIPALSPEELAWLLKAEQSIQSIPVPGPTSYSALSSIPATAGNAEVEPATTLISDVAHGKRRCGAEESYGNRVSVVDVMPPHKRVRRSYSGNPEAARSGARTCKTTVPTTNNDTSKEAGCRAERLATPETQGVYHCSLPGPSSQQGWVVTTAQGQQLLWVDEGAEEASHHIKNTVQQENEDHLFQIPSTFDEGYRILLAATEANWARRAVNQIRCRLCPNSGFKKWDDFQRHCKTTEAHPIDISFCEYCGDFFARTDSLKRHLNRPPAECLEVTWERAEEKRRETERVHRDFMERLEHSLTTGEEIGNPFAHIIKQKYPESSKKRTGSGWGRRRVQT